MNSKRIVNKEISMSNIKAAIELFFRNNGVINDSENVELLTFAGIKNPTTIQEWEASKVVPVQLLLKEDQVDVIHHT